MHLWYTCPAEVWNEALPLGNGKLGAMLFGGVQAERLELNEGTLWSGFPRDTLQYRALNYLEPARELLREGRFAEAQELVERHMIGREPETFQPLGVLTIESEGIAPKIYRRTLDLETATFSVETGTARREAFMSYPDNVLVYRWVSLGGVLPDLRINLESPHPYTLEADGDVGLRISGQLPSHVAANPRGEYRMPVIYEEGLGLHFVSGLRVLNDGGTVTPMVEEGVCKGLRVQGARAVTVLLTAASNYRGWNAMPDPNDPEPRARVRTVLDEAEAKGWDALRARHLGDYQALFNRVSFSLEGEVPDGPTDARLAAYAQGQLDLALESLYFHYGRYLLIACSRPGGQPANLQGIWNPHVRPPWGSDYTININTQMNYWPAEICDLGECTEPLVELLEELAVSGQRTARIHYNASGWTAHHNTDLWRMSTPTDGSASWAFWPLGGAWLSRQLWESYLFRPDTDFLARAWPTLKGAAQFLLDWLVETENGKLGTSPSTSPENWFFDNAGRRCAISKSTTMDLSIVRDSFGIVLEAGERVGDTSLEPALQGALGRLEPFRIGAKGQLQEWSQDFAEVEPGHRHVSHLYGLYPADLLDGPLKEAARRTLELRLGAGGGHTGWSAAWLINLFARLTDGAAAYGMVQQLLRKSTLPNLLDNHPPFQIDGNFGGTAGIAEMLLQSHSGTLRLLPALPEAWAAGEITGLRARGGIGVDLRWAAGELVTVRLTAQRACEVPVVYGDLSRSVRLETGVTLELGNGLEPRSGEPV